MDSLENALWQSELKHHWYQVDVLIVLLDSYWTTPSLDLMSSACRMSVMSLSLSTGLSACMAAGC